MEYVEKDDIQWGETDIAILSQTDISNLIQFKNLASPNEGLFWNKPYPKPVTLSKSTKYNSLKESYNF